MYEVKLFILVNDSDVFVSDLQHYLYRNTAPHS